MTTCQLPARFAAAAPPQRTFATSPRLLVHAANKSKSKDKDSKKAVLTVASRSSTPSPTAPSPSATLSPTAANPPATTRPPPLDLPTRAPGTGTASHLYQTGKAYLVFYKTGLKHVYLNTRLVWSLDAAGGIPTDSSSSSSSASPPVTRVPAHGGTTRAGFLLRRRWAHDVCRLPLFALILLVCGELTPFFVLTLPGAVPLTCRIPRQVDTILAKTEERRRRSFAQLRQAATALQQNGSTQQEPTRQDAPATAHIARSLNLVSRLWDTLGVPDAVLASVAGRKVRAHLAFLEEDTRLLCQAGGVDALEDAEVVLACADRGIDVVTGAKKVDVATLRRRLHQWVARVRTTGPAGVVSQDKIALALLGG